MKKILSLLLVATLVLSLTVCGSAVTASAETVSTAPSAQHDVPVFAVDGCVVERGDTFTVAVRTEKNPGIVSLKLALQYDTERLELLEATEQDFTGVSYGPTNNVPFIINWVDTIHPDNTTDGVITYLTFRANPGEECRTYLQLTYDPEDVYNAAWDGVAFATQSAYVNIVNTVVGDINDDGRINNRDLGVLLQYLNSWDVSINIDAADVNDDDRINNRDLGLLQQYVNGWDVELVQPLPPETPVVPDVPDELLDQVPDKLKTQKLKMMIWWSANEGDLAKADYFKEKTGVQVTYETASLDKYVSTLSAKIMAGNPPATAAVINEWYPLPITRGMMQPIKNTGWDYSNSKDDVYALSLMDQFSYKGEHCGVALKGSTMSTFEVMFFNKDLLARCGVTETPYDLWKKGQWNWETCLSIAKACTNASKEQYGLTLISQYYWMLSAGQDFVLSDANGMKNNIKSAQLLNTWTHAWDMINTHKVIPTNFSQQLQLFYNEQVAMLGAGSFFMQAEDIYSNYVPKNADFDWGVVPFPSPKGQAAVSACEGVVWGFPVKVTGDKLQAAMWWLRYYLDDATYADRDFYGSEQCWEVIRWMYEQPIQSYNSVGVVSYSGNYNAWSIQYSVIDESATKAQVQVNLHSWYAEIDNNIQRIESELS